MKTMNLSELNLAELEADDKMFTSGGAWWIAELIVAYVVIEWALNPASTAAHMQKGFEEGMKL